MNSEERSVTEAEVRVAEKAYEEFHDFGSTEKRCPRCGGEFIFEDYRSAYVIRCSKGDFKITARGL